MIQHVHSFYNFNLITPPPPLPSYVVHKVSSTSTQVYVSIKTFNINKTWSFNRGMTFDAVCADVGFAEM